MNITQDALKIEDINNDLVFLKDGSVTAILKTSAVNFGLLSDVEQFSIIESFAGLLNSLSFPIQIVIRSERMDVSSYLLNLDEALRKQTNPLMAKMIVKYRQFVESMIKENDVLDKQFYVCVNVSSLELGVLPSKKEEKIQKANTVLNPRLDHLVRQLSRTGLKTYQLSSDELVELFYKIYNETAVENYSHEEDAQPAAPVQTAPAPIQPQTPNYQIPRPQSIIQQPAVLPQQPATPRVIIPRMVPTGAVHLAPPFVVEELKDEYGP